VNAAGSEISNTRSHRDRGQGCSVDYQILAVCEKVPSTCSSGVLGLQATIE